jgi:hypothetical protein
MSAALYIVLENEIPGFDPFVNGKALSAAEKRLDALAEKLGVTPLKDFFSADPDEVLDFLETEADAAGRSASAPPSLSAEQWFDAADGLRTVRGLRGHLSANPTALKNAQAAISDLDEFAAVLDKALAHKIRWHLAVDF